MSESADVPGRHVQLDEQPPAGAGGEEASASAVRVDVESGNPVASQQTADGCSTGCLTGTSFSALFVAIVALIIAIVGVVEIEGEDDDDDDGSIGDVTLRSSPDAIDNHEYIGALFAGSGEWVQKPNNPTQLSDHVAIAASDHIYIVGGVGVTGDLLRIVQEFDTVTEEHIPRNANLSLPAGRARFAGCAFGEQLLVTGGFEDMDSDPVATTYLLDLEATQDPTSGRTWVAGPPLTLGPRGDLAAVATSIGALVVGGYGPGFDMTSTGTRVELLRFGADSWEERAGMPTPRGDVTAAYDPGSAADFSEERVFVVGGWNDATPSGAFQSAVEMYIVQDDAWVRLPEMPRAKGDAAVGVQQGSLLVVGGEVWSGRTGPCSYAPALLCNLNEIATHDAVSLDLGPLPGTIDEAREQGEEDAEGVVVLSSGLAWVNRAPIPEPLFRFSAAEVDGVLWVIGGQKQGGLLQSDVVAYYDVRHPVVYAHRRISESEEDD